MGRCVLLFWCLGCDFSQDLKGFSFLPIHNEYIYSTYSYSPVILQKKLNCNPYFKIVFHYYTMNSGVLYMYFVTGVGDSGVRALFIFDERYL